MLSEFVHDFRRCWPLRIIKCGVAVAISLCVYTVLAFGFSADGAIQQSFSRQDGFDIYSLVDSFMDDPEGFYAFRQNEESLRSLASFNDALSSSSDFVYLSVFDQSVPVFDFKGGAEFGYSYGMGGGSDVIDFDGRSAFNAKAIQINRAAFDFHGLRVAQGGIPSWDDVDWNQTRLPVLLGSAYKSIYTPGDSFVGNLYGRLMTFEVVGLLEEGSSIPYQGNPAFGLDYSISIPYPASFENLASVEDGFGGIVQFAYVNGELAVARGEQTVTLLDALDRIAQSTGFADYGVAGLYDYATKMAQVRQLIGDNIAVVELMTALVACIGCVILVAADFFLASRHLRRRRTAELLGDASMWRREVAGIALLWWAVTAVLSMLLMGALPYRNAAFQFVTLAALLLLALLDTVFSLIQERRTVR